MKTWKMKYTREQGDFETQPISTEEQEAVRLFSDAFDRVHTLGIYVDIFYREPFPVTFGFPKDTL